MNRFPIAFLTALAVVVAVSGRSSWLLAAEPTAGPTAGANEGVEVRYARAYLQPAQADLQVALEANEDVPGTYPEAAIEPLRQVVEIAEAQLKHALQPDAHSLHNIHIRQAEAAAAEAKSDLQKALQANQRLPGLMTPTELRRARLRLEVAQLALAKAKAVDARNASEHTQWQLEELQKELLQLRSRIEKLSL